MYIMSFVAAVPTAKRAEYEAHCTAAAQIFKSHGAVRVVECWGTEVPPGKMTSYPLAVAANEDETVVTGWQEWPDKATCDANIGNAMQDPRFAAMGEMPFDGKRMIYAGFETLLDT
ncbi:DUF1428 domain-containing protein [Sulfitobacter sp. SK012]|uniref:DUF1428 domain-containing protein n=1 Tax=Sulfitobacter sp. SK012 TaxID=1389005 RepID=UPI000E0B269E|nr:DUF1428 domain-containing protein [Sulfitobacter sp. SK012]AXI48113.1 DUF1428 domain-containing protein [Sulfitobacter sp. SK012]